MKIEIPLSKLLNQKKRKYIPNSVLYSIKTGKIYGTVLYSQIGDRGSEHVYILKLDGKTSSYAGKYLDKIVKIVKDDEKHEEIINNFKKIFKKRLESMKEQPRNDNLGK